ncbi:ribonuclease E inhibitor RraB [Pelomonas sp. Root1237]|uniref:ribonuclease E inhibitor RraB n=1 Tax=Pelomonas sp. Root1237 TaxID=1736434 RepID=UPI00071288E4|nr:ribonuclease E inhibitor RraB [Pelomonas sp. Root1237]KQV88164.1 hypothetical protein ASC91_15175 [Pelomonas sp. Root1237]
MAISTMMAVGLGIGATIGIALRILKRVNQPAAPDVRMLSQLRRAGSKLDQPHKIDFFLHLPEHGAASVVAEILSMRDFSAVVLPDAEGKASWTVQASRTLIPGANSLVEIRQQLSRLAGEHGGTYDGWGAEVVR